MTAIITGASRGIGRETALLLADCGALVVLAARHMEDGDGPLASGLAAVQSLIVERGGRALAVPTDLAVPDQRKRLVDAALSPTGHVDILINNAAITYYGPVVDFPRKRLELMFEVQVWAPLHLMQLALPSMCTRGSGWILNVSSVAAKHPQQQGTAAGLAPGKAVYGMCKAALERLTTGAALEHEADGVAINALSPSRIVPTPGTIFHALTRPEDPRAEPALYVAWAAMKLSSSLGNGCTGGLLSTTDILDDADIRAIQRYERPV